MQRSYGRYTVVATLGSGGMGDVHRARDERLGRDVAVKTVRNVAGLAAETFRARFDAEARALAALSHPAIVQVFDLGIENDEPYLVMELVDGGSLKARIGEGRMGEGEVRAMGIQLARALEAAHARHILHRDIKPANILRSPHGQWKLADFGIARVPDSDLTLDGQFVGTPTYAAPEALQRGEFSEKSDVFSLAVTLAEAATAARVRGDAGLTELVKQSDEPVPIPTGLPAGLRAALEAALARRPAARPTAARFAELLAGAQDHAQPADGTLAASPKGKRARAEIVDEPPAPAPPRSRNFAPLIAGTIVGLLGIGGVVALMKCGGEPRAQQEATPPGATALTDAAPGELASSGAALDAAAAVAPLDAGPALDAAPAQTSGKLPPIVPGRFTIMYPARARGEFEKVIAPLRDGNFDETLRRLDDFEKKHGPSEETLYLRAQVLAHPAYQRSHR